MKTRFFKVILVTGLALVGNPCGWSQGFVNLDFEAARLTRYTNGGIVLIPVTNALPGWTLFARGAAIQGGDVIYDNLSLSGGISIIDTNPIPGFGTHFSPIQGRYSVVLSSFNYPGWEYTVGIGQTGQVPATAQSISFWGSAGLDALSFSGQTLPLSVIGNGPDYNIYGADISAFAGQTGLLLLSTSLPSGGATIDNIQFSPSIIPEPGSLALAALGTLLLSLHRRRI